MSFHYGQRIAVEYEGGLVCEDHKTRFATVSDDHTRTLFLVVTPEDATKTTEDIVRYNEPFYLVQQLGRSRFLGLVDGGSFALGGKHNHCLFQISDPSKRNAEIIADHSHDEQQSMFVGCTLQVIFSLSRPEHNKFIGIVDGELRVLDSGSDPVTFNLYLVEEDDEADESDDPDAESDIDERADDGSKQQEEKQEDTVEVVDEEPDINEHEDQTVKITDSFRLYAESPYGQAAGYLGNYTKHQLLALGPGPEGKNAALFKDLLFTMNAVDGSDGVLHYNQTVALRSEGNIALHKTIKYKNKGYVRVCQATSGAQVLNVKFSSADKKGPVCFGDAGITVHLMSARTQRQLLNYRTKKTNLKGGYMHLSKGLKITFRIDPFDSSLTPPTTQQQMFEPSISASRMSSAFEEISDAADIPLDELSPMEEGDQYEDELDVTDEPDAGNRPPPLSVPSTPAHPLYQMVSPAPTQTPASSTASGMSKTTQLGALGVTCVSCLASSYHLPLGLGLLLVAYIVFFTFYTPPPPPIQCIIPVSNQTYTPVNNSVRPRSTRTPASRREKKKPASGHRKTNAPASLDTILPVSDLSKTNDRKVLPPRFLRAEKGDEKKAMARYLVTLDYREQNKIDTILHRPHEHFEFIKQHTKQFYHGRSKDGCVVYYEEPIATNLRAIKERIDIQTLFNHFVWITEYLWRTMDPDDESRVISVVGFGSLVGETTSFIKMVANLTKNHYPERSRAIIVVNAPWAISGVWGIISKFMDPATVAKTRICNAEKSLAALREFIDDENIPAKYHGSCSCPGGCETGHPDEVLMRKRALDVIAFHR